MNSRANGKESFFGFRFWFQKFKLFLSSFEYKLSMFWIHIYIFSTKKRKENGMLCATFQLCQSSFRNYLFTHFYSQIKIHKRPNHKTTYYIFWKKNFTRICYSDDLCCEYKNYAIKHSFIEIEYERNILYVCLLFESLIINHHAYNSNIG